MHDSGSAFDAGIGAGDDIDIERELFFAMEEETSGLGPPHLDVDRMHRSGRRRTAMLAGGAAAVIAVGVGAAVALSSSAGSGTGGVVADRTPAGVTATSASAAAAAGSAPGTPAPPDAPGAPTPSGAANPVPTPGKSAQCIIFEVAPAGPNPKAGILTSGTALPPSAVVVEPPGSPGSPGSPGKVPSVPGKGPSGPGKECVEYVESAPSGFPSGAMGSGSVIYVVSPGPSGAVVYGAPTPSSHR